MPVLILNDGSTVNLVINRHHDCDTFDVGILRPPPRYLVPYKGQYRYNNVPAALVLKYIDDCDGIKEGEVPSGTRITKYKEKEEYFLWKDPSPWYGGDRIELHTKFKLRKWYLMNAAKIEPFSNGEVPSFTQWLDNLLIENNATCVTSETYYDLLTERIL